MPCFNIATCDLGKRCSFSHILKYSMQLNNTKTIPCVHYIDNRCKFSAEECKFSHEEKYLNGKQRKQFLENRMLEDISEEEDEIFFRNDNQEAKYASRADRSRPPVSKRRRTTSSDRSELSSAYNSDATRYFPEPVPAMRRRTSPTSSPMRGRSRSSFSGQGNGQGARTQRSSQVSPQRRGGSRNRGRRGSSNHNRARSPMTSSSYGRSKSPRTPTQPRSRRGHNGGKRREDRR